MYQILSFFIPTDSGLLGRFEQQGYDGCRPDCHFKEATFWGTMQIFYLNFQSDGSAFSSGLGWIFESD